MCRYIPLPWVLWSMHCCSGTSDCRDLSCNGNVYKDVLRIPALCHILSTSRLTLYFLPITSTAIECSALTAPTNGRVTYSTDMTEPFSIGTVATFTCDDDYTLNGATATLTCADDNQADTLGTWGGSEPTCLGKPIHCCYGFLP